MATELATFAGGCFWCTEALFKRLKGVISVIPGYSGGKRPNPTYDQIHSGATGHAESIQLEFDPSTIPYERLVDIFFHTHNPTTKDRQNYDVGPEYRSMIFYHNEKQKNIAEKTKKDLDASHFYPDPIVTEIVPFEAFYEAEDMHKNFYEKYQGSPYCTFVIDPKLQKLIKEYGRDVKDEYK